MHLLRLRLLHGTAHTEVKGGLGRVSGCKQTHVTQDRRKAGPERGHLPLPQSLRGPLLGRKTLAINGKPYCKQRHAAMCRGH